MNTYVIKYKYTVKGETIFDIMEVDSPDMKHALVYVHSRHCEPVEILYCEEVDVKTWGDVNDTF